jgi:hypothetical protein
MATNAGMVSLVHVLLNGERLDIEDNIGEGIHIHYKNFRLDYTIKDMISIAEACEKALLVIKESDS